MLMPLQLAHDRPLQRQIYEQIRDMILAGALRVGVRMPSSRLLADQHRISRMTVTLAYERLIAEGYIQTRPSTGTFVAARLQAMAPAATAGSRTAANGEPKQRVAFDFRAFRPDPQLFPLRRWRALLHRHVDRLGAAQSVAPPGGSQVLRAAIASWLAARSSIAVEPEQIIVLGSRGRAMALLARLLLRPGQSAVVEAPGDAGVESACAAAGARVLRLPVDADGLQTDRLPEGRVALAHVSPLRQRWLGVPLAAGRRGDLLDWAGRTGAVVVEDDPEGDLHPGQERHSLMVGDTTGRVVHAGGFCAVLGPWVGLAYLALPAPLAARARVLLRGMHECSFWLEDSAVADFLAGGAYARHVLRLGRACADRRAALLEALRTSFGEATVLGGGALALAWVLPPEIGSARGLSRTAARAGLAGIEPIGGEGMAPALADRVVRVGFAGLTERQIRDGIGVLAAAAAAA